MKSKDWYLRVMVTLLVIGVWVLILRPVLAPKTGQTVRAQKSEVVDDEGKVRAMLAASADGSPRLALVDRQGKTRATLAASGDGSPSLELFDGQGNKRATLELKANGSPGLLLRDAQGKQYAWLWMATDGGPTLTLADHAGGQRGVKMELSPTQRPFIYFQDAQSKT